MAGALEANAIKTAVELGQRVGDPKVVDGASYAVIPEDSKIEWLDKFQPNPLRKRADVKLFDPSSFVTYYNEFKDDGSRIFVDVRKVTVAAILDYHFASIEQKARWREHKVSFTPLQTPEWEAWMKSNRQRFGQVEFAEFIENNQPDIYQPPAADMLQVSRDLQATTSEQFVSAVNLGNGNRQFKYQTQTTAKVGAGTIDVPEFFKIRLRIFQGGEPVVVDARLRYRIVEGKLTFWYDLMRPEKVMEEQFDAFVKQIEKETDTTPFVGVAG